jgi:hypothetical protein
MEAFAEKQHGHAMALQSGKNRQTGILLLEKDTSL